MRILYLSRNYPNPAFPLIGLWVEGLVRAMSEVAEVRVVAPVPYCPPLPARFSQTRFRSIPRRRRETGIEVISPRFVIGPGYSTHSLEADSYYFAVRKTIDRLRREFVFDVIHAQFGYPDGVAGARLARRYGVPLLITEHAPWIPWMNEYPRVRRQAVWAAGICEYQIAVSERVRGTISAITGDSQRLRVLPVGVDSGLFRPDPEDGHYDHNRIIYVGRIHKKKGTDVLFDALRLLAERNPDIRLTVVGGSLGYGHYRKQEQELRSYAESLGVTPRIDFVGEQTPAMVAHYVRQAAVLVLPSRSESFGAVLLEALATGVPVVATRCGGPEDFITDAVGRLVPAGDPAALAEGVEQVLKNRSRFRPEALRSYATEKYSWQAVAARTYQLYEQALARRAAEPHVAVSP